MKLASRFSRITATVIDIIAVSGITGIVLFPFLVFKIGVSLSLFWHQVIIAILGLIIFVLLNKKSLLRNGQTLGKEVLKIKITDLEYSLPSKNNMVKRYLVLFLPSYIPFIGTWLSVINCLFIFREDKRCIHDIVGKTIVVEVENLNL